MVVEISNLRILEDGELWIIRTLEVIELPLSFSSNLKSDNC